MFPAFLAGITRDVPSLPSTTHSEMRLHLAGETYDSRNFFHVYRILRLVAVHLHFPGCTEYLPDSRVANRKLILDLLISMKIE